ncbi:MAG TPA: hypothetical protein VI056_14370 [Candidatus Limnocylindria bacterium]
MRSLARLAFLAIGILVAYLAARDCVPSRVVLPSPTASVAVSSPSPTHSVTPSATSTPQSAFTLTVTDAELTKAAASSFPQTVSGVTVRDPVVKTTPSGVRLTATANVFFGTTQFVMIGAPYASAGRVAVRVDSVTLGGLALPDSVRASTAAAVESAIGRLVPSSVDVQRVTLGDGTVTIEGITQR